jgi:hypothetical protein
MSNHQELDEQTPKDDSPPIFHKTWMGETDEIDDRFMGNALSHEQGRLIIDLLELKASIVISVEDSIVLGREDQNKPYRVDIDLGPYGAVDRGVSRRHARLHRVMNLIYVTDLASQNGTFLNGERLLANQARILRDSDELYLGRFGLQVHIP